VYTCTQVKASEGLSRLPDLALRQRRQGLAKLLPPLSEILRGSLVERYVTCGNPACKCAKGERHGPIWYLTVTLGRGRTSGGIIPAERVNEVRAWIDNYHKLKDQLEKISEINRELLRRERDRKRRRKE
jgi:uncharacterized protein DUF6788